MLEEKLVVQTFLKKELDCDEDIPLVLKNRWKVGLIKIKDINEIKRPR